MCLCFRLDLLGWNIDFDYISALIQISGGLFKTISCVIVKSVVIMFHVGFAGSNSTF